MAQTNPPSAQGGKPTVRRYLWGAVLILLGLALLVLGVWQVGQAIAAPEEIPLPSSVILRQSQEGLNLSKRAISLWLEIRPEEFEAAIRNEDAKKIEAIRQAQDKRRAEAEKLDRERDEMRLRHDAEAKEARATEWRREVVQGIIFIIAGLYLLTKGYENCRPKVAEVKKLANP